MRFQFNYSTIFEDNLIELVNNIVDKDNVRLQSHCYDFYSQEKFQSEEKLAISYRYSYLETN